MSRILLFFLFSLFSLVTLAQTANRYDVLITEIMADPSPVVGLPNTEYIELKNRSGKTINLQGWKLHTATNTSGALSSYNLPADSFIIITSASGATALAPFAKALAVTGFPSLDNDGTVLYLTSKENKTIHALHYNTGWYGNAAKAEGGWSPEMINTKNPCTGSSNWQASTAIIGGTPGKKNSVDAVNTDDVVPTLQSAYLQDSTTVMLYFDEPLDSNSSSLPAHYSLQPSIPIVSAAAINPLLNTVVLKLAAPLKPNTIYTLTVQNITDCSGNAIGSRNRVKLGVPQEVNNNDVVINEILFNPRPNGYDYIEIFNRSSKIIDASQLYVANRNNTGSISTLKKITNKPLYFFPGEYLVITEDAASLQQQYFVQNPSAVVTLAALPSYPDNEGTVVLQSLQGTVTDEVHYKDDWHFSLISNAEGVALERLDPNAPSQEKSNWHSAASTAGFGTPGYKNSQYKQGESTTATFEIAPKTFSPDNDGFDDIAFIRYNLQESGYAANIFIYDAAGRLVRHLVKNDLLGNRGQWQWDGLGENRQRLPIGTYIIFTEIFNLQDKKQQFKNVIVLARRLN